jgi:hypothetical protein
MVAERLDSVRIIADLQAMTGYETSSRLAWQRAFFTHKKKVNKFVILGAKSALIRMGATAVGVFAGMQITIVSSWDELRAKMNAG